MHVGPADFLPEPMNTDISEHPDCSGIRLEARREVPFPDQLSNQVLQRSRAWRMAASPFEDIPDERLQDFPRASQRHLRISVGDPHRSLNAFAEFPALVGDAIDQAEQSLQVVITMSCFGSFRIVRGVVPHPIELCRETGNDGGIGKDLDLRIGKKGNRLRCNDFPVAQYEPRRHWTGVKADLRMLDESLRKPSIGPDAFTVIFE